MKLTNWLLGPRARVAMTSGVAAILFAVFGTSAEAQTWSNAGGSGNWFDGANWIGGSAPVGIGDDAVVGAPSPVLLNGNVNLNSLTIGADGVVNMNPSLNLDFGGTATTTLNNAGTINTGNNTDLQFQNSVINSGAINVNAGTSSTDIEIDAAGATLDGGGTITLSGINAGINGASGAALTIVDQTIQGEGSFGENSIQIVNQANGLVDANVNGGVLTIDTNSSGASNAGTMQASGGGILQITGSEVDNVGGQVVAQDGSEVRMASSSFTGGTFSTAGTGQLTVNGSTNVGFTDTTFDGSFVAENNSDTEISGTITNQGTMQISAGTSSTDIEVQAGDATLTGGGTVQLVGANAGINGVGTGTKLTIGDQTIEGQGSIGRNTIGVANTSSGLVDANVNGEVLNVDASGVGVSNAGTMQASGGGVLQITGSEVNNVGGQVVAQDGSEVRMASSLFTGGTFSTAGTGQLTVNGSTNVGFTDTTFDGSFVAQNNSDTEISGTITNQGTMQISAGTSSTDIEVQAGDATLTGGGTVQLVGANAGINGVGTGTKLTIGDQTIEGQGSIGRNTIGIVNTSSGLIDANVASEILQVDGSAADGVENDGVMQASNEGVLRLIGSVIDNVGGLIEAQADSMVTLNESSITGGTLSSQGTGEFAVEASVNVRLEDLSSTGKIISRNNSDTEIQGTIDNSGLMEVRATTSSTDIEVQADNATLAGGGTVRLSGTNAGINGVGGSTLTIGDQTIEGEGSIGENTIGVVNSANGLVDANVAGSTLLIDTSADGFDNDGVIQSSDQGILRVAGTNVDNADGLIVAQDNSEVRFNNATITGGRIDTEFGGQSFVEASAVVRFEDVNNTGNLFALNNSDTQIAGTFENEGEFEVQATSSSTDIVVQTGGATLTGGGTIRLSGANAGIIGTSRAVLDIQSQLVVGEGNIGENTIDIVNGPDGTIHADVMGGTITVDLLGSVGATVFTNDGTLRATNGGKLDSVQAILNNGTINTGAGSEVEARTLTSSAGSLISGEGTVDVELDSIVVAGTVAPGNSAGTLTFLDDTDFLSTALLETELASATLFDVLDVNGDLNLDGALAVDLIGGFDPLSADTFLIATANEVFGEFSNVSDGGLLVTEGGEGTFTVNYLSDGVQLSNFTLAAVPEPSSAILIAGIGFGLVLRRRRQK